VKNIAILGSTGSIGRQTLEVVEQFPERLRVVSLCAGQNASLLAEQARKFRPQFIGLSDGGDPDELRRLVGDVPVEVAAGPQAAVKAACHPEADTVVAAIVGAAGLVPSLKAVETGKDIALANKETMVMAGPLVMERARACNSRIIPVDSEHSAIFQALSGGRRDDVSRLILTASGGPFFGMTADEMARATSRDALKHPTWNMGAKVTIDSATMMNKGLELIEARWLFDFAPEKLSVQIHRQSVVHSMVEFIDGQIIAILGLPDMRTPIAYALSYPERLPLKGKRLDLPATGDLCFYEPDEENFPALRHSRRALLEGGTMPAALNAANEVLVEEFLAGRINLPRMSAVMEEVLDEHRNAPLDCLETVFEADAWARREARNRLAA